MKREIELVVKTGKSSHLIREIKEGGDKKGKDVKSEEPEIGFVDMIRQRDEYTSTWSVKARVLGSPDYMKEPILI